MDNYSRYFAKHRTPPKYFIGDRVSGKWNNIPFVGTVLVEHIVSEDNNPTVHVMLDLPIKYDNTWHTVITTIPKKLKIRK